jgi:hypothetical protein
MTTTTSTAPLFGVRTAPERRCSFRLMSYAPNGDETEHQFNARAELDASTALAATRSGTDGGDASFISRFLIRALVDDDGVSSQAQPEPVLEDDEEDPDQLATLVRSRETPELHPGEWEIDGKTFPSRSLALQHANEHGSSTRRFARLMDDPFEAVQIDALRQILQYVMEQAGSRPLARSKPSPPRRARTRR